MVGTRSGRTYGTVAAPVVRKRRAAPKKSAAPKRKKPRQRNLASTGSGRKRPRQGPPSSKKSALGKRMYRANGLQDWALASALAWDDYKNNRIPGLAYSRSRSPVQVWRSAAYKALKTEYAEGM
jgi:hypothetical protein